MAIGKNSIGFLLYGSKVGVDYTTTLTLGRQELFCSATALQELVIATGAATAIKQERPLNVKYCEPLFEMLGASVTDSMDFSEYEKATVLHDLNHPVPETLKNKYTAVIDVGTLEHVFNFPASIKNCMEMVAEGGHFICITPANNHLGHGFYQFSPELFYTILGEENGFSVIKILLVADSPDGRLKDWYEVTDPNKIRERVTLTNSHPLSMMVIARRHTIRPIFSTWPQQSDYVNAWQTTESIEKGVKPESVGRLKFLYRKVVPVPVKNFIGNFLHLFRKPKKMNEDMGFIDPRHFNKFNL